MGGIEIIRSFCAVDPVIEECKVGSRRSVEGSVLERCRSGRSAREGQRTASDVNCIGGHSGCADVGRLLRGRPAIRHVDESAREVDGDKPRASARIGTTRYRRERTRDRIDGKRRSELPPVLLPYR